MHKRLYTIYEDEEISRQDKLDDILEKLNNIEKKLSILMEKTEENSENCQKMSNHIDFIEKVYSTLKSPLEYVTGKLGFSGNRQLPSSQ